MPILVELDSEIVAAIVGRKDFDDPIQRNKLVETMFEVHSALQDLTAKCRQSRAVGLVSERHQQQSSLLETND